MRRPLEVHRRRFTLAVFSGRIQNLKLEEKFSPHGHDQTDDSGKRQLSVNICSLFKKIFTEPLCVPGTTTGAQCLVVRCTDLRSGVFHTFYVKQG